jgi:hypothetical protein
MVQREPGEIAKFDQSVSREEIEEAEPVPESFIRAMDDFENGRFVDLERGLNEPPPVDV